MLIEINLVIQHIFVDPSIAILKRIRYDQIIPAELLYIVLQEATSTNHGQLQQGNLFYSPNMFQLAFFKFRFVKRNILTLKENIIKQ